MARKKRKTKVEEKTEKKSFYETKYKPLLILPVALLILSLIIIGTNIANTGDFVQKGVSLKGGLTVTILAEGISDEAVSSFLYEKFPDADINVRSISELGTITGVIIEVGSLGPENIDYETMENTLISALSEKIPDLENNYSVETIGASLGDQFFKQTLIAILIAFVFMAIVVFLYFRTVVPSAAVILAAFSDIVITLAIIDLMELRLTTAGIAAFLMLIGYSVDTDILLSSRVLKSNEGTVYTRVVSAMKTGLVMNITTLAAIVIALLLSQSDVIRQIMIILFIGLLVDLINTWIQNAGILRWYLEK